MQNKDRQKLELDYPCAWVYKIIGPDGDAMKQAVAGIVRDRTYRITHSRSSETGKYHCLNVEMTVESDGHRQDVYLSLKGHPAVKWVL